MDLLNVDNHLKALGFKTFKHVPCKYYPKFVKDHKKTI